MRILFINPNTSEAFTQRIQGIVNQFALPSTTADAKNPKSGPRSIESIYDELLSSQGTLELVLNELDHYDAFVIACYSDHPTVYAIREITEKPVLGIAEASMLMACMVGRRFSVVTTNEEWEPLLWDAVQHYGLVERCVSIRTTGMPVLALEKASPAETYQLILKAARQAVDQDGAEVICLGCAGMTGMDKSLQAELKVPVIDGVTGALKLLEGMGAYGLSTSKHKTYRRPGYKELVGLPEVFYQAYRNNE